MTDRLGLKHNYKVKFINRSTGTTFVPPILSGSFTNRLSNIGEAEIRLANTWLGDRETGVNKLARDEIASHDIVEIWRDFELVFSGIVLKFKYAKDAIVIQAKSQAWLLTKQLTRTLEPTDAAPETHVQQLLKGWKQKFSDDFDRASLGSDWTEITATVDINSNRLRFPSGSSGEVEYNTGYGYDNFAFSFDYMKPAGYTDKTYVYLPYEDANNYLVLEIWTGTENPDKSHMRLVDVDGGTSKIIRGVEWLPYFTEGVWHTIEVVHLDFFTPNIRVYVDGVLRLSYDTYAGHGGTNKLRIKKDDGLGQDLFIENVCYWDLTQIIAEGTLNNYGSNVPISYSNETNLNAINERVRRQCASTGSGITFWEWKENPVAYVDATTPCANLDWKARIGTDQDITLSEASKNLEGFSAEDDYENYLTEIALIGAGPSDTNSTDQLAASAIDFDANDAIGFVLRDVKQISDERDLDALKTLADNWLTDRAQVIQNIRIEPLDFEKRGFQVGDGYKIVIPELKLTDTTTYYRVYSEKREFTAEGAEVLTIELGDEKASFLGALSAELRQQRSKAKYNQLFEAFGESTGTGAEQTIAHGLRSTPKRVILWNIESGADPYQSSGADETNIYITAGNTLDYGWYARVG